MWIYEKRLQYPINITTPNAKIAQVYHEPVWRPRRGNRRIYALPVPAFCHAHRTATAVLNDVGTEELAHLEMVSTIVHQLTRDLSMEEIEKVRFWSLLYRPHRRYLASGSRRHPPLMPANSSPKGIPLPTFMKIWLQSRKPAPLMTISSVWVKDMRRSQIRSAS